MSKRFEIHKEVWNGMPDNKEKYAKLQEVIDKLKARRQSVSKTERKELEDRICKYRGYRGECLRIAAILRSRHREAA